MGTRDSIFSAWLCILLGSGGAAQVTQRVSVDSGGVQGNSQSWVAAISAGGRYVVFTSESTNLVLGDVNGFEDVFVRDRLTGTTELASVNSSGVQATGNSYASLGALSADGRYVAFSSFAGNLAPMDTNARYDAFVHDRQTGTTERVSVDSSGAQGNDQSNFPAISTDGRYVAFASEATNLVAGDINGWGDIFVRDRQTGTTERVSLTTGGAEGNSGSFYPSISADGRYIAFTSLASNFALGDTNGVNDVFVHDRQTGTTVRVSQLSSGGAQGASVGGVLSPDGRFAVFMRNDNTGFLWDIFVHDAQAATIDPVTSSGSNYGPSISSEGRYVAFKSYTNYLVPGDTNGAGDMFVRDRLLGTTVRVSVSSSGTQGNLESNGGVISTEGRFVAFESDASNLVPVDTNVHRDVFVHDREATAFTSFCHPGANGVIACPCSNPPSSIGRGCDNSSATGGAILSASGIAYLSMDSLVFTTSGEKPTALSIATQWAGLEGLGASFGMGVRCAQGPFKRLYSRSAVGGSITAPDLGAGDPSVSARSAMLGDPISAGESRWYLVFYRDPIVLVGCTATSTFNATQTGRVDWSF